MATIGEFDVLNYMVSVFIIMDIYGRKRSPWSKERLCEEMERALDLERGREESGHCSWGTGMDGGENMVGMRYCREVGGKRLVRGPGLAKVNLDS